MTKVTLPPGILFNVSSDTPPTNIFPGDLKDIVVHVQGSGNKISLSFTLEIDNVRILEKEETFEAHELRKKEFLPFKEGTKDIIKIRSFEQGQNQANPNEPVVFSLTGWVPGGKIGGAGFLALAKEEKERY